MYMYILPHSIQDVLNEDMPELPEFQPPQQPESDVSIELQIPAGLAEVCDIK